MTVPVPLTDIEAAAGEATPGPWTTPDVSAVWGGDGWVLTDASYEDAAHIAAADPPTVLALCEALRIAIEGLTAIDASEDGCLVWQHSCEAADAPPEIWCPWCIGHAALARLDELVTE